MLVKALPQPSKRYGETVCCAGVTLEGQWKRLYPIRYRHLSGGTAFKRWDLIKFRYRQPKQDKRSESCSVEEDSIEIIGKMPIKERSKFLDHLILPSINSAITRGQSLALIRPRNTKFSYKVKTKDAIANEKAAYAAAAMQWSLLDKELEALTPTPYEFKFRFQDDDGDHVFTNGDWEAHAMFYKGLSRGKSEKQVLEWMDHVFNEQYPAKGMAFAVGNQAKRPQVWQLLGVLRLDEVADNIKAQGRLF